MLIPIAVARFKSHLSCGICFENNSSMAGSLGVLQFSLPILISATASHSLVVLPSKIYNPDTDRVAKQPTLNSMYYFETRSVVARENSIFEDNCFLSEFNVL
jgi:hypothetical protein